MSKEKEIEEMSKELHCATSESFISCRKIARILVERCGYGNVKQAVKEFADIVVGAMENYQYDDMTEREIIQKCLEGYLSENFTE